MGDLELFVKFEEERHSTIRAEFQTQPMKYANAKRRKPLGLAGQWMQNTERPHTALDYQTPTDYARTLTTAIARPATRDETPRVGRLLDLRRSAQTQTGLRSWLDE